MVSSFLASSAPGALGSTPVLSVCWEGGLDTDTGLVWAVVLSPVVVKLQGLGSASSHGEVRDPRRAGVGTQGWAECVGTEQRGEDRRRWDGENFCDYFMKW